jgi:signal transduction histidine kinase
MAWFSFRSLRAKLQLFAFLLVLVPGVILAVLAVASARNALEASIGRELAQIAGDALDELDEATHDATEMVAGWAQQDVMRDVLIGDLDKRLSRFFQTLTEGSAPFREIYGLDRTGRVVAANDPRLLENPPDLTRTASTVLRGEIMIPEVEPDGGDFVEMGAPIRDPDHPATVIGALVARYDWQHAIGRLDRRRRILLPYHMSVDVIVLADDGAIVGESWRDEATEDTRVWLREGARTLAGGLATPRGFVESSRMSSLAGWAHDASATHRVALVIEPLSDALAPVRRLQQGLTGTLIAVLALALAVATALAARMSRPLRELTRATQDLLRPGEPPRVVAVRSRDEIGTLASAFNTMGTALARAQDDLLVAAKFAFVGEVAAGIAHEVRTPLGIMRSSAQLLARTVPASERESVELAEMIVGEVDRIAGVVNGLLELARPRQPELEATALAPVLQRALDFVDGQAREKSLTVRGEFPPVPAARCDPEQVYQVALNLLVNAIQALPDGGRVTVRTLPPHDHRVGFEVEDDGPGIAPELQERVFTPFVSGRVGGTGLGLAIVQRMIQAHHGTVTLMSRVGRGTTFRVELPVAGDTR